MFAKPMLAAAAVAATLVAAAPMQAAEAKTNVNIHVNLGNDGWYGGPGYGYGYYDPAPVYYEPTVSCGEGARAVRWSGFHNVEPVDCSLPRYHYMAWKNHRQYLVTVNRYGDVTDWRRAY